MSDLEKFCLRYGLDAGRVGAFHFGQSPIVIHAAGRVDYDGSVEAIRIEPYARFGNTFFSILNALLIGQHLNVRMLEIPAIDGGIAQLPLLLDGLQITVNERANPTRPTIIGNFYAPQGVEPVPGRYEAIEILNIINRYVRRIYADLLAESGSLGPNVIVLQFRAGDIFLPGGTHPWYVQPPAAYYLKAIDHARRNLGVDSVHLVFEDRSNPCVDLVADEIVKLGMSMTLQSASITDDLATILSAHHLVAPYGTFCEATAILSPVLETYTGFRSLSSQTNIPYWTQSRVGDFLRARGIRTFVIDDPDHTYIAPDTWQRSDQQLALMREFPQIRLRLMEKFTPAK